MKDSRKHEPPKDYRRTLVCVMSVALLAGYGYGLSIDEESGFKLASQMMGRIGLLLGALWLAWPSLRRPAQWLPPGMALACVLTLVALAAQPKLIVVAIPAVGALIALSAVVRSIRGSK